VLCLRSFTGKVRALQHCHLWPLWRLQSTTKYRGESYDQLHDVVPDIREEEILGFAGLRAGQTGVIAVQPISRTWMVGKVKCERMQLPLDIAWAVSSMSL
jgi:hypothetical protein